MPISYSNLLPERRLRTYLAERAGVSPDREFFLLWVLGKDMPGAVTVEPADGEPWPPDADGCVEALDEAPQKNALRFSLAGVQLKFSVVNEARGGLTIPARGIGGSWIVKLPSRELDGVPENGVYPHDKHKKASYVNIASVIGAESGIGDVTEFVRR